MNGFKVNCNYVVPLFSSIIMQWSGIVLGLKVAEDFQLSYILSRYFVSNLVDKKKRCFNKEQIF